MSVSQVCKSQDERLKSAIFRFVDWLQIVALVDWLKVVEDNFKSLN